MTHTSDDHIDCFKVLANETRLQILKWLKDPHAHFPQQERGDSAVIGVCVGDIQRKTGCSQSTVSTYLSMLQRVGLLESHRIGKWTYYRRVEARVEALADYVQREI